MSTTAFRSSHSSRSFTRQRIQTSSTNAILPTMANSRPRFHSQTNTNHTPVPFIRESISTNSISSPRNSSIIRLSPSLPSETLSSSSTSKNSSNKNSTNKISKQPYIFSNPPREHQRQSIQNMKCLRQNRLRTRVSSAPDENSFQNSPRSIINQQKPSSANESSTPRSHDDNPIPQISMNSLLKRDEQQKKSLNALMKEQERSKVPKAVQNRRIILLFRRLPPSTSPLISPRQQQQYDLPNRSFVKSTDIYQQEKDSYNTTSTSSDSSTNDPFHNFDQAEIADSRQLAAILANIQSPDEWIPSTLNDNPSIQNEQKSFDPKKYEYVSKSSLDTTFKLSPRTLKPHEELAAYSRFSQNYRCEMLASTNAQIPPLMASIVTENNNTMGTGTSSEKTFTFRLNPSTTMKKQNSLDDVEQIPSTMDGEQVQLCFDEILKCFYDPNTGTYYELTSA